MVKTIFGLVFTIIVLNAVSYAQGPEWQSRLRQIIPLQSTEKDVERVFGKPVNRYADVGEYETKDAEISVTYSSGKCESTAVDSYNVEKGMVVYIEYSLKKEVKFKSLNINLTNFIKTSPSFNLVEYKNEDSGITFSISNKILTDISIYPAKQFSYLECFNQTKPDLSVQNDADADFFAKLSQLKVIQNTQEEVRNLYGKPSRTDSQVDYYLFKNVDITFLYSTGTCSSPVDDNWKIPANKIIAIKVGFHLEGVDLTLFNLDTNLFKSQSNNDKFLYYENEEGVEHKMQDGRIWSITYHPSKKYEQLRCQK
jgi:hypothetical protein